VKILILGCGPAGLIAAHAVASRGHVPHIYSKPRKSFMNGAQYLHAPIPDASKSEPFLISYEMSGSIDGYRDKVYGAGSAVQVSPETLVGRHLAWDIREAYDWLWDRYGHTVTGFEAGIGDSIARLVHFVEPDATISTIPAKLLCTQEHWFGSTKVWSSDYSEVELSDNTVLCQGEPGFPWYRASKIQGHENTEWPLSQHPDRNGGVRKGHGLWLVEKPTTTTCRCLPDVVRMGRYGQWKKGVLSHEAWDDTMKLIDRLEGKTDAPTDA
jgi:hypothetical protein